MFTQKQIENWILSLLEKNEFVSGNKFFDVMKGVDLQDIHRTLKIFEKHNFVGTTTSPTGQKLWHLIRDEDE